MSDLSSCFPAPQDLLHAYMQRTWGGTPCAIFLLPSSPEAQKKYVTAVYELFGPVGDAQRMCVYPCGSLKEAKKVKGKKPFCLLWDGKILILP